MAIGTEIFGRSWPLIALLAFAIPPCAAEEDALPAEEAVEAPVGGHHYETSEADPGQVPQAYDSVDVASVTTPAQPSGPGVPGISRRLGAPRLPAARTPSRASGGGAGPARTAHGPKADVRPFLTGYVSVPYLANPYTGMHAPRSALYTGDDSFGYDLDGMPYEGVGVILRSSSLPAGLSAMDRPDLGIRGAVLGVPLRAGNFFPHIQLFFLVGAGVKPSNFDGRVAMRILPAPRHTVLNPNERSVMAARFENDGPALLKVTLEGSPYWSVVRSADGVTTERVYFEAQVLAVGGASRVGVDGGRLLWETARIGEVDSWAYDFSGVIMTPQDGEARANLRSMVVAAGAAPRDGAARAHSLIQVPKIVPGDTVMVAFDPVAGYLWFGKNGRWLEGGDPATGAFPTVDGITLPGTAYHGDFRAAVQGASGSSGGTTVVMNFGDQPWRYAPPRGFGGIAHRRATSLPPYPAPDRTSLWASGDIR